MSDLTGLEIIENAKANLDSLAKLVPSLKVHPIFLLVINQLENGIKELIKEEDSNNG